MLIAFQHTSINKNHTFIASCTDYLNHFTSLRKQHTVYQDANPFLTISSQTPLYSYDLPDAPILTGPLITYQLHYEFLVTQLREQISIFNQKWFQLLTMLTRLKKFICTYMRSQDIYLFHLTNRRHQTRTFYTFKQNADLITQYRSTTNSLSQSIATLYTALDDPLITLTQQVKHIYALKFTIQHIEHLRNSPHLYSNTIYRHYHTYKSFSSTAMLSVLFSAPTGISLTASSFPLVITQSLSSLATSTTLAPPTNKPFSTNFTHPVQRWSDITTQRITPHLSNTASTNISDLPSDTTHLQHLIMTAEQSTKSLLSSASIKQPILLSETINTLPQLQSFPRPFTTLPSTFTLSSKQAFIIVYPTLQCSISL